MLSEELEALLEEKIGPTVLGFGAIELKDLLARLNPIGAFDAYHPSR
jgi:hypothetical protein